MTVPMRAAAVLAPLLVLLPACAAEGNDRPPKPAPTAGPPQYLPLTARWCLPDHGCLELEEPRGPRQFAWGLQERPPLPPMRGMWFAFSPPAPARFWMHRTPAPLDMVFVRQGRVIAIEARVPPCPRLPCPSYGPGVPVDGVLEIGAGRAAALGIELGTPVRIEPLRAGGPSPPAPD